MFVHGGFLHLFFNMLFLFVTGPFLEDVFGRLVFAVLYFGSGIAGALTHAWQHPDSRIPLIGASGAIAGVMGAFLLRLGAERIKFLFLPIFFLPFLRFTFAVRAFIVLPLWFLDQWLGLKNEASGGVALWAHIGGFSFGLLVALAIKVTRVEERVIHPAIESEITWSRDPRLVAASDARHRGDLPAARRHAEEALKKDPEGVDAWAELVEVALRSQDAALIGRSTSKLLDLHVAQGEDQLARHLVQSVWDHGRDAATPDFLFVAGRVLERAGDSVWAVDAYRLCAERVPFDKLALRALLRRAEILKATKDLNGARDAVERALAHPFCSDRWYEEAERLRTALG
jgi:hypothetical protein